MVTFIPLGERPNREGVEYAKKILLREGLITEKDAQVIDARNLSQLMGRISRDCCYITGEHLATYAILNSLEVKSLVSVDAHTDLMHDYLDHGSWLAYALEERKVEKAAVIGPVLMIPTSEKSELWRRRVQIYPALPRTYKRGGKWRSYINLKNHGIEAVLENARRYLGNEIYLTVDLDVLRPEYKIARFQHGELTLDELLDIIDRITKSFNVIAFDISELSNRIKRSKEGKKALIEIFSLLKEGIKG